MQFRPGAAVGGPNAKSQIVLITNGFDDQAGNFVGRLLSETAGQISIDPDWHGQRFAVFTPVIERRSVEAGVFEGELQVDWDRPLIERFLEPDIDAECQRLTVALNFLGGGNEIGLFSQRRRSRIDADAVSEVGVRVEDRLQPKQVCPALSGCQHRHGGVGVCVWQGGVRLQNVGEVGDSGPQSILAVAQVVIDDMWVGAGEGFAERSALPFDDSTGGIAPSADRVDFLLGKQWSFGGWVDGLGEFFDYLVGHAGEPVEVVTHRGVDRHHQIPVVDRQTPANHPDHQTAE
ncbi:Uncharacterised protein [Mycobacteroides abscessus subsp. abscessus]|nr:Uncharacterised protein [Mycobacteroides abscessus subsp. abscessus]